ncbi:MAG TPA: DUF2239 family protein [Roseiarcus sp.]|jgi:hypothetical protein
MPDDLLPSFTAFAGPRRIDSGALAAVAASVKRAIDAGEAGEILIFDDSNARTVEIDFRGSLDDVRDSVARAFVAMDGSAGLPHEEPRRGPGRPRLGVVAREVTLLPRHWQWLARQPGGASVALRRLVEEAAKDRDGRERRRLAQEAAYRFMSSLAGNRAHYEEAVRALFAGSARSFAEIVAQWPKDIADYAIRLAGPAFGGAGEN